MKLSISKWSIVFQPNQHVRVNAPTVRNYIVSAEPNMSSGCYWDTQEGWCGGGGTFVSISSFFFKQIQVHVLTITVILFTGAVIAVKCPIYTN